MSNITISQRSPLGGGNLCEFFALGTNAFGTKQTHVEDHTKSTKVTGHPIKNKVVIDLDARHADETFDGFLTTYLYSGDLSLIEESYEDSQKDTSAGGSTSYYFGYILYFASLGVKRKVLFGVGVLTGSTGDYTTGDKQFEQSPVQISGVSSPVAYTVPASCFNTYKVSGATTQTVALGSYGQYKFLTAV